MTTARANRGLGVRSCGVGAGVGWGGGWGSQGDPGKKEQGSGAAPGLRWEMLSQNKKAGDVFVGIAVAWHAV